MSIQRKWYSISGVTWFLMIILLVAAYYWLFPEIKIFYIVAGITIGILMITWILSRRTKDQYQKDVNQFLKNHHTSIQEDEKRENPIQNLASISYCSNCGSKVDTRISDKCSNCGSDL